MSSIWQQISDELSALRSETKWLEPYVPASRSGVEIEWHGRRVTDFTSYNIFGFAERVPVGRAIPKALSENGLSSGACRAGSGLGHDQILAEGRIAQFVRAEASLFFPNGRAQCILSAVTTLFDSRDIIFVQEDIEAPIADAAVLAGARVVTFQFGDLDGLRKSLGSLGKVRRKAIFVETARSTTGEIAEVESLASLAAEQDALLFFDDTHALGAVGTRGAGATDVAPLFANKVCSISSLAHFVGSQGAFISGPASIIETVLRRSWNVRNEVLPGRFVFLSIVENLDRVELMMAGRSHIERLSKRAAKLLAEVGIDVPERHVSPILGFQLPSLQKAHAYFSGLVEHGIFVSIIPSRKILSASPTLRIILSVNHTESHIDSFISAIEEVKKRTL